MCSTFVCFSTNSLKSSILLTLPLPLTSISARGPIYSHLSESLLGLSTIRTFGRENAAQEYFHEYVNQHTKLCYLFIAATRWFVMRNDTLATALLGTLAFSSIPLASSEHYFKVNQMAFL